ncbi:MAG: YlbF family regulator [Dethiobacter sp.]|nr:YlbF family regulator [Dethiobacter sp.]MBS3897611.1 YlbF family regulator [Dethiobacter sp.]
MNPLRLAENLAEAILASEQYREFARVKEAMDASEEASNLIENFHEQQHVLRDNKQQGNKITEEQMAELALHQRQMLDNPEINAYFAAKKNVEELLAAVNETIARITGMETGRGNGHGGGGCGCGCR